MNIIGISAFYHDAAACLLQDGQLVAAASEERFTRVKNDPRLPVNAFKYCLKEGGLNISDVDAVAFYETPVKKLSRQLWAPPGAEEGRSLLWLDPNRPIRMIQEGLGWCGEVLTFDHHLSHAASAWCFSGFDQAAVMVVDGVGEWATTSYARAQDDEIDIFEEVRFPHSLGLLYATITSYLGFEVNEGEYKVMGLAPYGNTSLVDRVRCLINPKLGGGFELEMKYFDFLQGDQMYSNQLCELMGEPPRKPESVLTSFHMNVARALQVVLEEVLLEKVSWLAEHSDTRNLCLAGGVALNCVANGRIIRESPFKRLFVQPAAGDAGGCLGAAMLARRKLTGSWQGVEPMNHVYLGPGYSANEALKLVQSTGLKHEDYHGHESALLDAVVERLSMGKVVGWFQGRMEFGPRALGSRSILANPLDQDMQERLNQAVKKRESFRPFAPAVLQEHASSHFDLDHPSPFMLETCLVNSSLALPGVTHVDQSARPQTVDSTAPRFAALIERFFEKTGCPMLVNTSFNVRGEPIVCTIVKALLCMTNSGLDCLVIEDVLIDREWLSDEWIERAAKRRTRKRAFSQGRSLVSNHLYTFV